MHIKWYSCGPTVYNNTHIGHARSYICQDIIRRIIQKYERKNITYVMGITDIDDKIIKRSNELKIPISDITKKYEKEFFDDFDKLNIIKPTVICRVTEHLNDINNYIQKIIDNGYGYSTPSGVYFDTNKLGDRYNIFNINFNDWNEEINADGFINDKHSPKDFALWKYPKTGPLYPSPFGPGRPGWHIECSAMSNAILGGHLDIHSGGEDLKFPHHMNENAQSIVYNNNDNWVDKFLHIGHMYLY